MRDDSHDNASIFVTPRLPLKALCVALGIAVALPVHADPNADRANDLFQQGRAAYSAGHFADADRLYEQAWLVKKSPDVAANLGQVELQLGHFSAAANHFAYALDNLLPSTEPVKRQAIERNLDYAKERSGTLRVRTAPTGAEVFVNGDSIGAITTERDVFVDAGEAKLVAKLSGREDLERDVNVQTGQTVDVVLELAMLSKASVGVGSGLAESSAAASPAQPLAPSQSATYSPAGSDRMNYLPAAVTLGAGVVTLAAGIGFFIAAGNKISEREDRQRELGGTSACTDTAAGTCAVIRDLNDQAGTFRTMGVVGFVLAGASGVATYFLWPRHHEPAVAVAPEAGPQAFRLNLLGHF